MFNSYVTNYQRVSNLENEWKFALCLDDWYWLTYSMWSFSIADCYIDYQRDPEGNQPKTAVQAATLEMMTMGVLMVFLGMGAAKSVLGGHTFDSRFQSCDAPQTKPDKTVSSSLRPFIHHLQGGAPYINWFINPMKTSSIYHKQKPSWNWSYICSPTERYHKSAINPMKNPQIPVVSYGFLWSSWGHHIVATIFSFTERIHRGWTEHFRCGLQSVTHHVLPFITYE